MVVPKANKCNTPSVSICFLVRVTSSIMWVAVIAQERGFLPCAHPKDSGSLIPCYKKKLELFMYQMPFEYCDLKYARQHVEYKPLLNRKSDIFF